MPFFENATQFEINGGNFIDVKGNQNNYNYDQSLNVSGQGNSAVYARGPYYNGPDSRTYNTSGHMTVIGQGSNARVALDANAMMPNYSPSQMNYGLNYAHPANAQSLPLPQSQPHSYGPSLNMPPPPHHGRMFFNSTGHVNQQYVPAPSPNHFPPSPQPMGHQCSPPPHHSQSSVNSAPANVQQVQINQSAPHVNGSASSNEVPQQSSPPRVDNHTRPQATPLPGTTAAQSTTDTTGSMMSGTTLAQSTQPTHATTSPSIVSASVATTATQASTSSTSSAVTPGQSSSTSVPASGLTEFPDLIPIATVPLPEPASQEEEEEEKKKKKKKKKRHFFSGLFGRTSKETSLAANA